MERRRCLVGVPSNLRRPSRTGNLMDLQQVFKRTLEDLASDPRYRKHWRFVLSIPSLASLTPVFTRILDLARGRFLDASSAYTAAGGDRVLGTVPASDG